MFGLLVHLMAAATAGPLSQEATAPAARIDHVAIIARDLDASARFYMEVFGLREVPAAFPGPRWFDLGGGAALHILGGRTAPVANVRAVHLAIATANLDTIIARLKARGVEFTDFAGRANTIGAPRKDGVRQIFVQDPDGYWLEINDALSKPDAGKD